MLVALIESPAFLVVAGCVLAVFAALIYYFVFASSGKRTPLLGKKKRGPPFGVSRDSGRFRVHRAAESPDVLIDTYADVKTLPEAFRKSVAENADRHCLGTRKLVKTEKATDKATGRVIEKLTLGQYEWKTYREVANIVENFGAGLAFLGHKTNQRLAVWCETSATWQISAQAAFARSFPVVTVYDSLGPEAAEMAFEEAEVGTVIVDAKKVSTLKKGKALPPCVKRVIFVGNLDDDTDLKDFSLPCIPHEQVVEIGAQNPSAAVAPTADQIAVIMYTSGTTSRAKGVLIAHRNLVSCAAAVRASVPSVCRDDTYLAYLPLAHILELMAECTFLSLGVRIGYGSPLTMADNSPKVQKGSRGDCPELQPTLMAAVPAILDRIRRAVNEKVSHMSPVKQKLFHWAYARKEKAFLAGRATPVLDKLVFTPVAKILGGRLRMLISGGAPLSTESELFFNVVFCTRVGQGYGLTESTGIATIVREEDRTVGHVGAPFANSEIRLVDWPEGGYLSTDKPYPRGEIVIGGPGVTMGYLNNPEKTAEAYINEGGSRWFFTGDIGLIRADGNIQIVDRKKDLVKLSHGEYISLGLIEASISKSPLIESVCVYADSYHDYCIAIIVPNFAKLAGALGETTQDVSICDHRDASITLLKSVADVAKSHKLSRIETPKHVIVARDLWTPESGLVTAALKLKREQIKAAFKTQIDKEYI